MTQAASPITPSQMREARTILGWSRLSLSSASGVTVNFIQTYEETGRVGRLNLRRSGFDGLGAIRATLERVGIEFVCTNGDEPGVRTLSMSPISDR